MDTFWIGVLAQLVDGALGYGYGATATAALLASGMPPLLAAASSHASSVTASGVAALLHWRLGNVDRSLWLQLAGCGVAGAICGVLLAVLLARTGLQLLIGIYLLLLGLAIVRRGWRPAAGERPAVASPGLAGFCVGLLDAGAGGGWRTLTQDPAGLAGRTSRRAIGSAAAAGFCIAATATLGLLLVLGSLPLQPVLGLLAGAVLAAPFGARLAGLLRPRLAATLGGSLLCVLALASLAG